MRASIRTINKIGLVFVAMVTCLSTSPALQGPPQSKLNAAKSLRCTFAINSSGTWQKNGKPESAAKPSNLVLQFEAIDTDEGTARLRTGSMDSDLVARWVPGYLHFIQSFRSGPLYTTTVFDKEAGPGRFKAVHSRHQYFTVPIPGATSNPEQYYGECEVTK